MTTALCARDAIVHEFGTRYLATRYLADELPHPLLEGLPALYNGSAARLARATGPEQHAALLGLLRAMRDDPSHPLLRAIEDDTAFEWSGDPES